MQEALPFDRVTVTADGQRRELSAQRFLLLPLHLRISHILARQVEFFAGTKPVDRSVALQSLRRLKTFG